MATLGSDKTADMETASFDSKPSATHTTTSIPLPPHAREDNNMNNNNHDEDGLSNMPTPPPPSYQPYQPYPATSKKKWFSLPTWGGAGGIGKFKLKPVYEKPTLSQPARIFGIKRLWFLIGVGLLFLIIFIIGLAAGLSAKKKMSVYLPLPSSAQTFHGDATYYDTGLGACGWDNPGTEHVVAVSHLLWDSQSVGSNPNANPLCGLKIRATRYRANNEAFLIGAGGSDTPGGKNVSVDVRIVDRCTGCASTDLDFSRAAFDILADQAMGRVLMDWAWL